MKSQITWKIHIILGLILSLVFYTGSVFYSNFEVFLKSNQKLEEYREISSHIEKVIKLENKAQELKYKFLIIGKNRFKQEYLNKVSSLNAELANLIGKVTDNNLEKPILILQKLLKRQNNLDKKMIEKRALSLNHSLQILIMKESHFITEEISRLTDLISLTNQKNLNMQKRITTKSLSNTQTSLIRISAIGIIILGVMGLLVYRDIRKQTLYEETLCGARETAIKASEFKSRFLANMSHEIRTPMNSILGMAEVLSETPLSEEQRFYVETFQRSGASLLTIINDILDISKVEAGEMTVETIETYLDEVLADVTSIVKHKAKSKNITLAVDSKIDTSAIIFTDPTRLKQILINLVGNAIKFTSNGSVTISIDRKTDSELVFSVKDTGKGIPPEKIEDIFKPFSQADLSTTRNFGGTGLGLSISKKLVELLGGKIWATSKENKGSTFFFSIKTDYKPIKRTSAKNTDSVNQDNIILNTETTRRILVADDSPENRGLIKIYLKDIPFEIEFAENGKEAFERFKDNFFDLVFMDIQMPELDGYGATKEIRKWESENSKKPTPIVALTACALDSEKSKSEEAGCTTHLTKPIKKKTLIKTISQFLNNTENAA